jgi:hypothetical protein
MAKLILVHDPVGSIGKPRIVFIHGLDGHLRETWMSDPSYERTLWPKWIGEDTECPVWLLGYEAASSRWKADALALPKQATAVLDALSNEPGLLEGPIILVGHSLGGLVIKTAMRQGMLRGVERHEILTRNIRGVAFVGTPHFGSIIATVGAKFHLLRPNPHLDDLSLDNERLEELNHDFRGIHAKLGLKTRTYVEAEPVRLPWWLFGRLAPGITIVSPSSSEAHMPGEVGIRIQANHITISKPKDMNAPIHRSLLGLVRDVASDHPMLGTSIASPVVPLPSASNVFEGTLPENIPETKVHLAFSLYGISPDGDATEPMCSSVCLITDTPDELVQRVAQIRTAIKDASLVSPDDKRFANTASLRELATTPGTRVIALSKLTDIWFSAYLYYASKDEIEGLTNEQTISRFVSIPLFHRLSKKRQIIEHAHSQISALSTFISGAAQRIEQSYNRKPELPKPGKRKYSALEELAGLVAEASALHLADKANADAAELFARLRTRIRYAENVVTGAKHTRDRRPLL